MALFYALAFLLIGSLIAQAFFNQAQALTAATFADQPTFTSLNSGKWSRVWANTAGTSTYFLDTSAANFKSVKVNNTGAIQATKTGALVGAAVTTTSATGSTTKNDIMMLQSIGGTDRLLRTASTTFAVEFFNSASAEMVGTTVNEAHLWLKHTGTPGAPVTATVAVFDAVGSTVYSFGTIDCAAGTTGSYVEYTFRGATTGRLIANGDRIGIFFNGGSAGNECVPDTATADRYDGTANSILQTATGAQGAAAWTSVTASDLRMQLGFDYVAALANDNDAGASYWENAGYTVRAAQTDSDATQSLAGSGNLGTPLAVLALEKKTTSSGIAGASVDQIKLRLAKTGSPTGTISIVEVSATGSTASKLNQAAGTITANVLNNVNFAYGEHITSGAALIGQSVNSVTFGLKRTNSPVGTLNACILDASNNCVYTFGTALDVSLLLTTDGAYTFTNYASSYTIALGDYIGVKYTGGSAANTVTVEGTSADAYDTTKAAKALYTSSWGADTTTDLGSSTANTAFKLDLVVLPTILNTFNTIDASSLTSTETIYTFTSASDFTLSSGATTYIGVLYTGGSFMNGGTQGDFIKIARSSVDAYDGTANSMFTTWSNGAFTDTTTFDLRFRLIDTPSEAGDQESGAFIKWDVGSNLGTGGVKVFWKDVTKIPSSIKLSTSTDDAIYTDRVTISPTQSTGFELLELDADYSVRYVKMTVVTWGSAKSMAVGEYQRLPTVAGISAISDVETVAGVNRVYYVVRDSAGSGVSNALGIINIDTGDIISSVTINVASSSNNAVTISATKNKVYWEIQTSATVLIMRGIDRDLTNDAQITGGGSTPLGSGTVTGRICQVAVNGAALAQDVVYCSSKQATTSDLDKITSTAISSLATVGAITDMSLLRLSDKVIWRTTLAGVETTKTITVATDAISAALFTTTWLTKNLQQYDFDGTTFTFKAGSKAYYASSTYAIAYTSAGVLTDPEICYVETVTSSSSIATCIDDTVYYRISNSLIVSGSGTTWTPRTITAANILTLTPYTEHVSVPLTNANYTVIQAGVIKLACDANYPIYGRIEYVGSVADCTKWRILPTSSDTIGRELPFEKTIDLIHANPQTSYTITLSVGGDPSVYFLRSIYGGKDVDTGAFDSGGAVGQHLLYGQCYTMQVEETTSGNVLQTGNICANDITTKAISLSGIVIPDNWLSSTWSMSITRNKTNEANNGLLFAVEKSTQPYNASVFVTNNLLEDQADYNQWFNFTNVSGVSVANVTGRASGETIYFNVYENNVDVANDISYADPDFSDYFSSDNFGLLFGLSVGSIFPILTAAMFPKRLAYFGAIVTVAIIGIMAVFRFISLPIWFWPLIMPVLAISVLVGYKRT